ncbi:MAG TPA: hypothetical protein VIQ79_04815 [Kribbella sp.]
MAVWIPVTVVPRSEATVAIETFITELSSAIRNWPDARVIRTVREPVAGRTPEAAASLLICVPLPVRIPAGRGQ